MSCKLILVVDPDESTCRLIEGKLNGRFQVLFVPQGKRALEMIRAGSVDIAIVARCLPNMDGLELLRQINQETPALPVVFIASCSDEDLVISALRAGVKDFFKKPVDADNLMNSVNNILNVARKDFPETNGRTKAAGTTTLRKTGRTITRLFKKIFSNQNGSVPPRAELPDRIDPVPVANAFAEIHVDSAGSPPTELRFNFLGNFLLVFDEQVIDYWPSKKGKAILAYLAYNHKRRTCRDMLMDIFWPAASPDSARNCLNVCLHGIRQLFHEMAPDRQFILFKNDCYFFNPELEITTDVEDFMHYWRLAQSTEREKGIEAALGEYELAAALYKDDFMQEDLYDEWTTLDRENLKEIYLVILDRLCKYYSFDGKPITAVNLCKTILDKDNCREDIHRLLMKCYSRLGYRDRALRQFYKCVEVLKKELEVEPTTATLELFEEIKRGLPEISEKLQNLSEN